MTLDYTALSARLHHLPPDRPTRGEGVCCAVAMILRDGAEGVEMLLVQRAEHPGDPWSGNLGFPGGKREPGDPALRDAAERETREEIGLDLRTCQYLGFLGEIEGSHLPVRVACFVYRVGGVPTLVLSEEIADIFWVPLSTLGRSRDQAEVFFAGECHRVPCFRLDPSRPILWGLTYRLIERFLPLVQEVS